MMKTSLKHRETRVRPHGSFNERRRRLVVTVNRGTHGPQRPGSVPDRTLRVIIYQSEFEYMAKCILDKDDIETGGQLFGHWASDGTPIVLFVIGPGPNANHQVAFFNQDMDFLVRSGHLLRERYGLHHIGEWHSHHQLGLEYPSRHDVHNMVSSIRAAGLGRFLLSIGTCRNGDASARIFLCDWEKCSAAEWNIIPAVSPVREMAALSIADTPARPSDKEVSLEKQVRHE